MFKSLSPSSTCRTISSAYINTYAKWHESQVIPLRSLETTYVPIEGGRENEPTVENSAAHAVIGGHALCIQRENDLPDKKQVHSSVQMIYLCVKEGESICGTECINTKHLQVDTKNRPPGHSQQMI